jgi:uncharacterized protein YwbE
MKKNFIILGFVLALIAVVLYHNLRIVDFKGEPSEVVLDYRFNRERDVYKLESELYGGAIKFNSIIKTKKQVNLVSDRDGWINALPYKEEDFLEKEIKIGELSQFKKDFLIVEDAGFRDQKIDFYFSLLNQKFTDLEDGFLLLDNFLNNNPNFKDSSFNEEQLIEHYKNQQSQENRRGLKEIIVNDYRDVLKYESLDYRVKKNIKSPISGVISKVYKHKGDYVKKGEVILTVIDDSKYFIESEVSRKYLNKLSHGLEVDIILNNKYKSNKRVKGVVYNMYLVDRSKDKLKVQILVENRNNLFLENEPALVKIDLVAKPVYFVPNGYLKENQKGHYLIINGSKQEVEIGIQTKDKTEVDFPGIKDGLYING